MKQETCDLCDNEAGYHLCQVHLDDLRGPDVFSTTDGDYPEPGRMVVWHDGSESYLGGYDPVYSGWFTQEDQEDGTQPDVVLWCYLPDLQYLYDFQHAKGGKHAPNDPN